MRRCVLALLCSLLALRAAAAEEKPADFAGTWMTTFSTVTLEQVKARVTGTYGRSNEYRMEGQVTGRRLSATYREGDLEGEVVFDLEPSGRAMKGTFKLPSLGREGAWNGWRQDEKAATGTAQKFTGLWLTRLGVTELVQSGAKVSGRWAFRGPMDLDGEVAGRRFTFRYRGSFGGGGWVELGKDRKSFDGAINDDGQPGWGGFSGRALEGHAQRAKPKAGAIVDGVSSNLLTYHVRAPEGWTSSKPAPTLVLLHGSNMTSKDYVATVASAWPALARRFLLLGIDGESYVEESQPGEPRFNYSYTDYVGRSTFRGFPGTDRESPALVTETVRECVKAWNLGKVLVGGHSQGAFLTYSLFMNFPEVYAGAFPISGGLIFQCEPSAYAEAELRAAQRRVPLAIVHGTNDPLVEFGMSRFAHEAFGEAGQPALRLFTSDTAGHMFAMLPVAEAIEWLDAMTSTDPEALAGFAEARAEAGAWRDVGAVLVRAKALGKAGAASRLDALEKRLDVAAGEGGEARLAAITTNVNAAWVDDFLAWRDRFEFAPAARAVLAAYAKVRAAHQPVGEEAMGRARKAFREGRAEDGYAAYQAIVGQAWGSSWYPMAKRALAERR